MPENLQLSAPWVNFYRQIDAVFKDDPNVIVEYSAGDGDDPVITMYVEGTDKAEAIAKLLPSERTFGAVTVSVKVVPSNAPDTRASLFRKAFEGNPALSYIATVEGVLSNPVTYVVFRNKVVQYYNDNLGDVNGNCSTLYQNIASELFGGDDGIFFCTDRPDNPGTKE